MSETQSQPHPKTSGASGRQTLLFMIILSFSCALILSVLASALAKPKEIAKDLDRSKQLMIAAKILSHGGYFILADSQGKVGPAKFLQGGILEPTDKKEIASRSQLLEIYAKRVVPLLVDNQGELKTFQEAGIKEEQYLADYKKSGYYRQPLKLIYKILSNSSEGVEGYVIPVNGFGLWDAIYGYLALKPDGDTVTGITWYDQKETPGLGANIAEEPWQSLFPGKKIFQESSNGKTDLKFAPLGIVVVKGKVSEVLGNSPKAKSAVDGMAGATLTGNGVTDAYRDVLAPYRPFLIKLHEKNGKSRVVHG